MYGVVGYSSDLEWMEDRAKAFYLGVEFGYSVLTYDDEEERWGIYEFERFYEVV